MVGSTEIDVTPVRSGAVFGIKIDFSKSEGDPSRVFTAMSDLVKACQDIDRNLVRCLQVDVEPILILENIESGSIVAWLRNTFRLSKNTPEMGLDSEKLSEYLAKSKFAFIDYTSKTTTITTDGISNVQLKILEVLHEKNPTPDLPIHNPLSKKSILTGIQQFQSALAPLDQHDDYAEYMFNNKKVSFNLSLELTPDSIEDLLVSETLVNINTSIMKVKKPDYLGASQWEFKYGNQTINVKIKDLDWLGRFHSREITLAPGDSLKAEFETTTKYDVDNELLSTQYVLLKVIECIQAPKSLQLPLKVDGDD